MAVRSRVSIHRVYEPEAPTAGARVLVDRLWPRGLTKQEAALDEWARDVAPSTALRVWHAHDPARYEEFARRYRAERRLSPAAEAVDRLERRAASGGLVLLTATRDLDRSGARVLRDHLVEECGEPTHPGRGPAGSTRPPRRPGLSPAGRRPGDGRYCRGRRK